MAGARAISELMATLIVIAIVVGVSIFISWLVFGTVGSYRQSTSLNVVGGSAQIDPTDQTVAFGDVVVSIVGPDPVSVTSIRIMYSGNEYVATCLNCNTVLGPSYPNSANDVVALRFYFRANSAIGVGSRLIVRVTYTTGGETKYAVGTIYVNG